MWSNSKKVLHRVSEEKERRRWRAQAKLVPRNDISWKAIAENVVVEELDDRESDTIEWKDPTISGRLVIQKGNEIGVYYLGTDGEIYDEISNKKLDYDEVVKARLAEMRQVAEHGVYQKVPIEQCWAETGKAPIRADGWTSIRVMK